MKLEADQEQRKRTLVCGVRTMLSPRAEKYLDWYFCQTEFERSVFGAQLERAEAIRQGLARYYEDRREWIRDQIEQKRAAGIKIEGRKPSDPWPQDRITARPGSAEHRSGGNLPDDWAYERKAAVETVLLAMERMGERRSAAVLAHAYDPTGGYFDDRRMPRSYALLLFTEPGLKVLEKAFCLLDKDKGERDLEHHEQMALHCKRRENGQYGGVRELFARAEVEAEAMYRKACVAWNAAADAVEKG